MRELLEVVHTDKTVVGIRLVTSDINNEPWTHAELVDADDKVVAKTDPTRRRAPGNANARTTKRAQELAKANGWIVSKRLSKSS